MYPHDTPTHLLENPQQYITRVGRILRKTSLDELPQIFQIFTGKMAVIGPRPALWNQYDLIAQRDLYGANDVRPGLTGWAQINGRDELPIDVKARLDGEYVKKMSFLFDCKEIISSSGTLPCVCPVFPKSARQCQSCTQAALSFRVRLSPPRSKAFRGLRTLAVRGTAKGFQSRSHAAFSGVVADLAVVFSVQLFPGTVGGRRHSGLSRAALDLCHMKMK